jgi:exosortase D (VPLPA-CTERM-specific)
VSETRKQWFLTSPFGAVGLSVVVALSLAYCFRSGIASLIEAWERPEYSHGFLIPLIAILIGLIRGRDIAIGTAARTSGYVGVLAVLGGLAAGAFGALASIPDIVTYGLILSIGGLLIAVTGLQAMRQLWPAWVYLLFMLPLPNFIYWPLSIKLQFLSSEIGVWLIKLLGIPVFLEGNIIDLGVYKLQVAEACSGLRYLFPLMSFGFLAAVLYSGRWWQKLLLFLSTIPITIAMNSFRIAVIGVLVDSYGIKQAEGFLHFFEGWVIFIACILLLYAEAVVLKKLAPTRGADDGIFAINFDGLGSELKRWLKFRPSKPVLVSAALLLFSAVAWPLMTDRTTIVPNRQAFGTFPLDSVDWKGRAASLEPDIERVLGADDYLFADFSSSKERAPVNLLVSYYNSQTSGAGIHSPEVCIPAGGWEVSRWEQAHLNLGPTDSRGFEVNRAIIQKGQFRQLVYYWFEQRGRRLTSDYATKAYTVWDSVSKGRSDGALVRVVTAIEGNDVSSAELRLGRFLEFTLAVLPEYVPQ